MLAIQKLVRENSLDTIEQIKAFFSEKPYCLKVSTDDEKRLYLLKYNQISSDFRQQACMEARGIIFDMDDHSVVCRPFDKFFNVGESLAAKIDWKTAVVEHKEDGSLIKVYFHKGEWIVATNGTIDARNAQADDQLTFQDLFDECAANSNFSLDQLDERKTYLFELLHPRNVIVEPHDKAELVHLSTRDNKTGQESRESIGVRQAQVYPLSSRKECEDAMHHLAGTREGYVVRDAAYNRVKIKNPVYVKLHHSTTDRSLTTIEAAAGIILENETSEVLSYQQNSKIAEIGQEVKRLEALLAQKTDQLAEKWRSIHQKVYRTEPKNARQARKMFATHIGRIKSARSKASLFSQLNFESKQVGFETTGFAYGDDETENDLKKDLRQRILFCKSGAKVGRSECRDFLKFLQEK